MECPNRIGVSPRLAVVGRHCEPRSTNHLLISTTGVGGNASKKLDQGLPLSREKFTDAARVEGRLGIQPIFATELPRPDSGS